MEAELARDPGSRVRVRVVLERAGRRAEIEVAGVGQEPLMLRLAAEATVGALEQLVGTAPGFELVGVKRLVAFDAQVVLACLRHGAGGGRQLIGAVPAPDTLVRGVASAVLDATNRLVEILPAYPRPPDA